MRLEIGNSESQITGLSMKQHKELSAILSYENKVYGSKWNRRITLLKKSGKFPSGLLKEVKTYLREQNCRVEVVDTRVKPVPGLFFKMNLGFEPYMEQVIAVDRAIAQHRGIISATTGFGKSAMIAMLIKYMHVKTLIVVPTLELKRQLSKTLTDAFGSLDHIRVENIDSKALSSLTHFDMLIVDEAHHVASKTYRKLNLTAWKGIYYRFFFTATPFRNITEENIVFRGLAGSIIYEISHADAVAQNYVCGVEAYYYTLPKVANSLTTWPSAYSKLVTHREDRNKLIADLLGALKRAGKSVLCLVKEIEHGNIISELSGVHFANGVNEDSSDLIKFFSEGKLKGLIGTVGVVGEGVDTKAAEYIIIAGLGKSKPQFMQNVGRGVRMYPGKDTCKVIIFNDPSHRFTKRHFKEQLKTLLDNYGVIAQPLE